MPLVKSCPQAFSIVLGAPVTRLLEVHYEGNLMLLNGLATHLATAMRGVNHLSSYSLTHLPLIEDLLSFSKVPIEDHRSVLTIHFLDGLRLINQEPFLEISLASVQMSLIFRPQALSFQLLAYGSTRYPLRKPLQYIHNLEMDFARSAGVVCQGITPWRDYQICTDLEHF